MWFVFIAGADWEDDEAELKEAARQAASVGGVAPRSVLATLGRRDLQMVSEDERSEDEDGGDSDGDSGSGSDGDDEGDGARGKSSGGGSRYLYNAVRQGPKGPLTQRASTSSGGAGLGGTDGLDENEEEAEDGNSPSAAAATSSAPAPAAKISGRLYDRHSGKRKRGVADDSILGSVNAASSSSSSTAAGGVGSAGGGLSRRKQKEKKGPNAQPRDYRRAFAGECHLKVVVSSRCTRSLIVCVFLWVNIELLD